MPQISLQTVLGNCLIIENQGFLTSLLINTDVVVKTTSEPTPILMQAATQLKEYLAGRRQNFDLPLKPIGTPYQQKVWGQLVRIPYGQTRSYQEIAEALGNRKAARAVGNANHRNPLPIFIPCHRVIGKNGSLVGYAYGVNTKEKLLKIEESSLS